MLVDVAVVIKDVDGCQAVALTRLEIIRVVSRGDLDRSRSEGRINELVVNDDGNRTAIHGMDRTLACTAKLNRTTTQMIPRAFDDSNRQHYLLAYVVSDEACQVPARRLILEVGQSS